MTRTVPSAVLLVAVYALMLRSIHPLDLLAGAVVAAVALGIGGRPRPAAEPGAPPLWRRLLGVPGFVAATARDVVVGTAAVTLTVLGRRPVDRGGLVEIPIGERTPDGVVVSALALTLSPGELLVDVDEERGVMLIHVLDASDPEAVRRHHERFYERRQRKVIP